MSVTVPPLVTRSPERSLGVRQNLRRGVDLGGRDGTKTRDEDIRVENSMLANAVHIVTVGVLFAGRVTQLDTSAPSNRGRLVLTTVVVPLVSLT